MVAVSPGGVRAFAPTISPDGKYVVYLSDTAGRTNLWVKFIDGGPAVNITEKTRLLVLSEGNIGGPDVSPDGRSIAMRASPPEKVTSASTAASWILPAPLGGPARKLVEPGAGVRWSPDGRRIAYAARSGGKPELWLVSAIGGSPTPIPGVRGRAPAWSPTADVIAYVAQDKSGVRVGFTSSTGQTVIDDVPDVQVFHVLMAWSHDGRRLALLSIPAAAEAEISVLDLQPARKMKRIAIFPFPTKVMGLSWTADDRSIVFGRVETESTVLLLDGVS